MRNRSILIFLSFLFFSSAESQVFRNYRFSTSCGAGIGLVSLLSFGPYAPKKTEIVNPLLTAELTLNTEFSLEASYRFDHFNARVHTLQSSDKFSDGWFTSDVNSKLHTFYYGLRRYSKETGYMAPWGRFFSYGLFASYGNYTLSNDTFSAVMENNGQVTITLPEKYIKAPAGWGFQLGFGQKKYRPRNRRTFFEYQVHYGIQFRPRVEIFNSDNPVRYVTDLGLHKLQLNQFVNFSISYGFSL